MRALLSVYDKTGIIELARGLHDLGWDLVSSGGTARAIRDNGIPVADTFEVTGFPAILGHRVVTLHPKIHGGILADRSNPHHITEMADYGIEPFDLVVGNLYPFGQDPSAFAHGGGGAEDLIDIGGPALVRAAAKNHAHVGVVVKPSEYSGILEELRADGVLSPETRRRLARAAFAHTAAYDAAVVAWFDEADDPILPPTLHVAATMVEDPLRYGENPHQRAALYQTNGANPWWAKGNLIKHGGVAMGYVNMYDADAAWLLVHSLAEASGGMPAVAIIKHANPCGAAIGDTLAQAYQEAFDCDSNSAFGGVVALSEIVDDDTVVEMVAAAQADIVIAPGYAPGVIEQLKAKRKNTRLLEAPAPVANVRHLRPITGGWLVQEPHRLVTPPADWKVVTDRVPTEAEMVDAIFAMRVCAAATSNAIVAAKDLVAWGIGCGQQNRVQSVQIAGEKAAGRAQGGALASDAFFPFTDGIEQAGLTGVAVIVQPGGSVNDQACIDKANELGIAMVFTGERQFKH